MADALVENEARGAVFFIKLCVADPATGMVDHDDTAYFDGDANRHGKLVHQDRLANYKTNRLGPHTSPRKNMVVSPEYILVRVMQGPDGNFKLEGMVKDGDSANVGSPLSPHKRVPDDTPTAHAIPKNTYIGCTLVGREG